MKQSVKALINSLVRVIPSRFRHTIEEEIASINLSTMITRAGLAAEATSLRRCADSRECAPRNEAALVPTLVKSFTIAKEEQSRAPSAYRPSHEWKTLLEGEWREYYQAISRGDESTVAAFLRNFFRNEGISGFWGGTNIFESFRNLNESSSIRRDKLMLRQFVTWRALFPSTPLSELSAPPIGNPWGYEIDGELLYEPVFEYHYHANFLRNLVSELDNPVILEIGGGFGGMAHHLLRTGRSVKYIGFDLPENILIQTYYLTCAFPEARLLTFSHDFGKLDDAVLRDFDIILLPNFALPRLADSIADLIVNVRSLSEMSKETICEYHEQIDRVGKLFFFHENIAALRGDGLYGLPSTQYPPLRSFRRLIATETRWPRYQSDTLYPCQENLSIHSRVIS